MPQVAAMDRGAFFSDAFTLNRVPRFDGHVARGEAALTEVQRPLAGGILPAVRAVHL